MLVGEGKKREEDREDRERGGKEVIPIGERCY